MKKLIISSLILVAIFIALPTKKIQAQASVDIPGVGTIYCSGDHQTIGDSFGDAYCKCESGYVMNSNRQCITPSTSSISSNLNIGNCIFPSIKDCNPGGVAIAQNMNGMGNNAIGQGAVQACQDSHNQYQLQLDTYNTCLSNPTIKVTDLIETKAILVPSCMNPFTQEELNNIDLLLPKEGMQKIYNLKTGLREDQLIGKLNYGYTSYNPRTRKDIEENLTDNFGGKFEKFSDGTYAYIDENMNYSNLTEAGFTAFKEQKVMYDKVKNGTYSAGGNTAYFGSIILDDYYNFLKNFRTSLCNKVKLEKNITTTIADPNESCTHPYGPHSIISPKNPQNCTCADGYQWSIDGKSCVEKTVSIKNPITNLSTTTLSNSVPLTYNLGTKILKNGSTGDAVKELQRFLNDKLNLGLVLDGKLGPKTIAVIKEWQKNNGLVADGLIGPKTKELMK